MKKSIKTRVICLIIAGVMLTGALTVAAINGSPYETLKNAFFNALTYENFTLEGEVTITFNGELYDSEWMHFIQGYNSFLEFGDNRSFAGGMDDRFRFFSAEGIEINPTFTADDGTRWYAARANHPGTRTRSNHIWWGITAEERGSAQVRFFELLVDLFVGDLRNNVNMSQEGDIRRVHGTITHSQLPEIIKLGIEMIIEENLRWEQRGGRELRTREDFRHPMDIPVTSLNFNNISGEADIDAMGNLLYLNASANITAVNIFGDVNTVEFSLVFNFADIGTSVPQSPVAGALEILTPDFFEREFSRRYGLTIYFTRNEDGSINPDSITATWPGSLPTTLGDEIPRMDFAMFMEELEALGVDIDLLRVQLDETLDMSLEELFGLYKMLDSDIISLGNFLDIWVDTWN